MTADQQFAAKVAQLLAQSMNLTTDARKKILEMLDAVRTQIIGQLAQLDPKNFTAMQLGVLKQQIDALMAKFGSDATNMLDDYETKGFNLGAATVADPLQSLGLESSTFGQISQTALGVVQGYTADLVTALSADAAAKLNGVIQRAFLGGQSITDIIDQVGRALSGDQGFSGVFSAIGKRATDVTMNEILRVHSIAGQARLEDAAQRHPDLQKQWHHLSIAKVPRPSHVYADGQVVNVDQPFVVDGEELMYPRDPNGSPENTINCHCLSAPYFAAGALKPTAHQKGLLDALGISVSAA